MNQIAKNWWTITALGLAALFVVPAIGQIKKGKTRPLTTKQLMSGLVKPNCGGLGGDLKKTPEDQKSWDALATKAALLNETSHILMADGRCPDGVWAGAAKLLGEQSAEVLKHIEAENLDGANAAFQAMTKSCGNCHKKHKK